MAHLDSMWKPARPNSNQTAANAHPAQRSNRFRLIVQHPSCVISADTTSAVLLCCCVSGTVSRPYSIPCSCCFTSNPPCCRLPLPCTRVPAAGPATPIRLPQERPPRLGCYKPSLRAGGVAVELLGAAVDADHCLAQPRGHLRQDLGVVVVRHCLRRNGQSADQHLLGQRLSAHFRSAANGLMTQDLQSAAIMLPPPQRNSAASTAG